MARKKKHPEHVNHERWLISYADFITLLFAFFVVMFAVSQVDSRKVGRFTESFSRAIGVDIFPQLGRGLMAGASEGTIVSDPEPTKASALPEPLAELRAIIMKEAKNDEKLQDVQIITRRHELVLRLSDNLLFQSGNDTLDERPRKVIAVLAAELRERAFDIRVEGHTDNRPIRTARFRSNWDLSTARATSIVARLNAEGIAAPRLSAAGYGEFHPVAANDTDDGRKQNRRVDIVVTMPTPDEPLELGDAGSTGDLDTATSDERTADASAPPATTTVEPPPSGHGRVEAPPSQDHHEGSSPHEAH